MYLNWGFGRIEHTRTLGQANQCIRSRIGHVSDSRRFGGKLSDLSRLLPVASRRVSLLGTMDKSPFPESRVERQLGFPYPKAFKDMFAMRAARDRAVQELHVPATFDPPIVYRDLSHLLQTRSQSVRTQDFGVPDVILQNMATELREVQEQQAPVTVPFDDWPEHGEDGQTPVPVVRERGARHFVPFDRPEYHEDGQTIQTERTWGFGVENRLFGVSRKSVRTGETTIRPVYVVLGIFSRGHAHPRERVVFVENPRRLFRRMQWTVFRLRGWTGTFLSLTHVKGFGLYKVSTLLTPRRLCYI